MLITFYIALRDFRISEKELAKSVDPVLIFDLYLIFLSITRSFVYNLLIHI